MKKLLVTLLTFSLINFASAFELFSSDVTQGKRLKEIQTYRGFGCNGENLSPSLQWSNVPASAQSFAVTIHDPDAPTGSGWWHWVVYDIPANVTDLPTGAGSTIELPIGVKQGSNDFGTRNFGGACPPVGDKPHHYVITVYALKVEKLGVPENSSSALIGFMLNSNSISKAQITAIYSR